LPELLPFGAMAALDTALQTAPLTRAARCSGSLRGWIAPKILSLDPGLPAGRGCLLVRTAARVGAQGAVRTGLQSRVDRHFSGLWTDDVPMMTVS
jgi:hypothetical protein